MARPWKIAAACLLVTLLAVAEPQRGRSQSDVQRCLRHRSSPRQPRQDLRYVVAIEGVDDAALRGLLQQVSETERLIDRPPPSLARLRRRAQDDRPRLLEVLRSEGYYDAQVEAALTAPSSRSR